jgi:hypothetical protein
LRRSGETILALPPRQIEEKAMRFQRPYAATLANKQQTNIAGLSDLIISDGGVVILIVV